MQLDLFFKLQNDFKKAYSIFLVSNFLKGQQKQFISLFTVNFCMIQLLIFNHNTYFIHPLQKSRSNSSICANLCYSCQHPICVGVFPVQIKLRNPKGGDDLLVVAVGLLALTTRPPSNPEKRKTINKWVKKNTIS